MSLMHSNILLSILITDKTHYRNKAHLIFIINGLFNYFQMTLKHDIVKSHYV